MNAKEGPARLNPGQHLVRHHDFTTCCCWPWPDRRPWPDSFSTFISIDRPAAGLASFLPSAHACACPRQATVVAGAHGSETGSIDRSASPFDNPIPICMHARDRCPHPQLLKMQDIPPPPLPPPPPPRSRRPSLFQLSWFLVFPHTHPEDMHSTHQTDGSLLLCFFFHFPSRL